MICGLNGVIKKMRQTVVDGEGGVCIKGPKSKAGMRIVVVPGIMLAELQRLRETRQKEGRGDKKHLPQQFKPVVSKNQGKAGVKQYPI